MKLPAATTEFQRLQTITVENSANNFTEEKT